MNDISAIKKLENYLGREIPIVEELSWVNFGIQLDYNQKVIGLTIYERKVSDISLLKNFESLQFLGLGVCQISDISPIAKLKNLIHLHLGKNQITDISPLEGLSNLSELYMGGSQVKDIFPLRNLKKLTTLYLGNNQISDLSGLKGLENLRELYLYSNKISDISALKDLKNLVRLNLDGNMINDISPLADLENLTHLNLNGNPISDLFPIKKLFSKTNFEIGVGSFNLKSPPPEIFKQGNKAVGRYFKQLEEQGKDYIYEAKLMLVGEPGAGKTSLMNKLFDRNFKIPNDEQKSTLGIEVRRNWKFIVNDKEYKAHIWDFGGQQIQYMLHQFFITSDCLYILVAEKRRELTNFDYWLNIINILGKNSPIIVLLNEINIDSAASAIYDEKKYKELFPDLNLLKLDVNIAITDDGRFDVLLNTIKEKIKKLKHIGKEVPARWVDIRRELLDRIEQRQIHIKEYFGICEKYGISKEDDQIFILKYFHILGIVLHFYDDENLRDVLFIDPNWTVDAVYSVLTDKEIELSNGVFTKDKIEKLWIAKNYGFDERSKLFQLMLKRNFELCYEIPGNKDKYITPLLLSKVKPIFEWGGSDDLQFRFLYPFMPKGIISRLIVRLNEYLEQDKVWNEGAVFTFNTARAQVIEKKTPNEGLNIIEIRITGTPDKRKELLTLIREEIRKIQNSSFPELPYSEMVPCICTECRKIDNPHFYSYNVLQKYITKDKRTIECRISTDNVSITELIGAVYSQKVSRFKLDSESNKLIIKIFLASSSELVSDRKEFREFISFENDRLNEKGIHLLIIQWEHFLDAMSETTLQDEYNKAVKESDIFVCLFFTKVGIYTDKEFDVAYGQFIKTKKPLVYTYFKDGIVEMAKIKEEEINSKFEFERKLKSLGHFPTVYNNIDNLKNKFKTQLEYLLREV